MADKVRAEQGRREECPLCGGVAGWHCRDRRRAFYACEHCYLIFADPASHVSIEEERAIYDLHENDPGDVRYRRFLNQLAEPLLERLEPGMKGLDFGCGPGPLLGQILREAGMVVADYDPLYSNKPKALTSTYDFVTSTEVVEHFCSPGEAWEQLTTLVRPGGWLGIMTALVPDRTPAAFKGWYYKGDPTHVSFYSPETMQWLGAAHGFSVELAGQRVVLMQKEYGQ
ncbi:MAG: class I SAM-dependent methyltransferase [Pseudomonadota bacterium]